MNRMQAKCDKCKEYCNGNYYQTFKQFLCDDCLDKACEEQEQAAIDACYSNGEQEG